MTPAQLDHLQRLDAHLAKLLDIAASPTSKRKESSNVTRPIYRNP